MLGIVNGIIIIYFGIFYVCFVYFVCVFYIVMWGIWLVILGFFVMWYLVCFVIWFKIEWFGWIKKDWVVVVVFKILFIVCVCCYEIFDFFFVFIVYFVVIWFVVDFVLGSNDGFFVLSVKNDGRRFIYVSYVVVNWKSFRIFCVYVVKFVIFFISCLLISVCLYEKWRCFIFFIFEISFWVVVNGLVLSGLVLKGLVFVIILIWIRYI